MSASLAQAQEAQLEEIVVTAQKREENLQRVPVSVQAVGGETIARENVVNLEGLSQSVPTLQIGSGGLSEQLFIRGIGSGSNQGFEQSTGTYLDGVYFGVARLSRLAFLDVERVEVLKGPQSTLFGKSTIAGAINITSGRPRPDFGGRAVGSVEAEGAGRKSVNAFVTGPLGDNVSARLAVSVASADGAFNNTYVDEDQPGEEQVAARLSILATPTERLEVLGTLQASYGSSYGRSQQIGYLDTRFAGPVNFRTRVLALDPRADFTIDDRRSAGRTGSPNDERGHDRAIVGTLNLSYDFGPVSLNAVTGYVRADWREDIDADSSPLPIVDTLLSQDISQFSQELRIESNGDGRFTYMVGAYYQTSEIDVPQAYSAFDFGVIGSATRVRSCTFGGRDESNWGVFAQGTFAFTDRFRLTGGARYQEAERDIVQSRVVVDPATGGCTPTTNPAVLATAAATLGYVPYTAKVSAGDSKITPTATLEFDMFDGGMAYISYRTGFKSGGFDLSAGRYNPTTFQYDPESAKSIEAGVKMRLLDGRARLNINVFDSTFENLQVSAFNGTGFTVGNAAEARSRGVEVQGQMLLFDGFTATVDVAYLDAYYEDFPGAQCYANQATVGVGCVGGRQNLKGHVLPFSPEWSGAVRLDYRRPLGNGLMGSGQIMVTYRGEQEVGPDGDPNRLMDASTKVDLRLALGAEDERWEVALVGKNLTDEMTANFGFNVPLVSGAYVFQVDPPRTIAIQLTSRF
ncbi:MAG: TonB-dependent receptor [Caulobacter sp.]